MWPTVILSGVGVAAGPDETAMMVVYERPRETTPKWCEKKIPRLDAIFVINSHIQVRYAEIRALRAHGVMSAKHNISWGVVDFSADLVGVVMGRGGGASYRFERTSEPREPILIPGSAVINTKTHSSRQVNEERRSVRADHDSNWLAKDDDLLEWLAPVSNESHLGSVDAAAGTGSGSNSSCCSWYFAADHLARVMRHVSGKGFVSFRKREPCCLISVPYHAAPPSPRSNKLSRVFFCDACRHASRLPSPRGSDIPGEHRCSFYYSFPFWLVGRLVIVE